METREHAKIDFCEKSNKELLDCVSHSIGIADAMNECIWIGDKNHKTIYINPVYEMLSGYSLQECIGRPADFCFDEESKETIEKHHKLRKKGLPSQYEATMVSKYGKKIPLLISGAPTKTGHIVGVFFNMTKMKELSKQETFTKKIFQHTDKAFAILDKDRKVMLWSNGAKILFGYKEEEVIGKKIDVILTKEDRNVDHVSKLAETKGHVANVEGKRIHKSGKIIDVSVSATKVTDDNENFLGYLLSYRNITLQKQYGTELQKRFEAIQDAYKELGLQKRHLDYFCDIASAGTSTTDLEELEKLIVSAVSMLTKCDGVVLREYDGKSKTLKLKYCFGANKNWWNKSKIPLKDSLAEETFNKKRAIIIDNIDSHPKHKSTQLLKNLNFNTLILLPLQINDKPLGTISLYAVDPAKFRFIETTFLENLAKLCSLAIHSKKTQKV